MALQVGLQNQTRIAGALLMSGYLLESEERPVPPGTLPIAVFHGCEDEVVPISAAEGTVESLRRSGYAPTFKSYPGLGHSVTEEEVQDVFGWLGEWG